MIHSTLRIIVLFFWGLGTAFAQSENPIFWHMGSDDGLSSSATTSSIRDQQGYLWIATRDGLNKIKPFDYFDIYHFERNDSSTLSHDHVTALHVDETGVLWVGTAYGLNIYNYEYDNFTRIPIDHEGETPSSIHAIYEDGEFLYLGTDKALVKISLASKEVVGRWMTKDAQGKTLTINAIVRHEKKVFFGVENGLYCLVGGTIKKVNEIEDFHVLSLASSQQDLFIGTLRNGLIRFNIDAGITGRRNTRSEPPITSNRINTIARLDNGDIWMGTDNGINVCKTSNEVLHFTYDFEKPMGISGSAIEHIYEDEDGSLWVSTALSGLSHYHAADNQFRYVGKRTSGGSPTELLDYNVLSMYADQSRRNLWIGSRSGISAYNEKEDRFTHYPFAINGQVSTNHVLSITSVNNDLFYLGTQKGLFLWDDIQKTYISTPITKRVNKVFVDSKNTLLIGMEDGVLKSALLNDDGSIGDRIHDSNVNNEKQIKQITDIVELPEGKIWIGTSRGLFQMQDQSIQGFEIELDKRIISDIGVNFIHVSTTNTLIVGTKQEGAVEIMENEEAFVRLDVSSGLMSNDVRSHFRGPQNSEWVATNSGLASLEIKNSLPYIESSYYVQDGLQSNHFNPNVAAAMSYIYIGGPSGLTIFDPTDMNSFDMDLSVVIQGLMIDGSEVTPTHESGVLEKTIGSTERLILPAGTDNFSLEFLALDYLRPDSVVYSHRLSPYEQDWVTEKKKNIVTYTSLPKGRSFTFEVKAKSRYRNWSEVKQLEVYIEPFFYETNWFKALVIISLGILFFTVEWYRSGHRNRREQELANLVEAKTHALSQEVDEKRNTMAALQKAKNQAEQATKAKSQFLAKMSHEIRTPLNGILGITNILFDDKPSPSQKDLLSILKRSSLSLKSLIDDLLDLSKIEAEKIEILHESLDLKELLLQVYEELVIQANQKSLDVGLAIDDETPRFVLGDAQRLKQVLLNLTSNALKFTDEGSITISAKTVANLSNQAEIEFEVKDTGIGIEQKDLKRIFSNFVQVGGIKQHQYSGTGLGLGISERLVKLMGGNVWVESEAGHGATFRFTAKFDLTETEPAEGTPETEFEKPTNDPKHILVVEDNPVNTLVAVKHLERLGHHTSVAENGQIAVEKLEKEKYDLVLMDVQMPVMDGYEATVIIRNANHMNSDIPIIALSAGAMISEQAKCIEQGMNDFLSKPIIVSELQQMLSNYLKEEYIH